MTLRLSQRSARIEQAEIRAMSIECEKRQGINLAQGVCDTTVPVVVRAEAARGIEAGFNSYTRFDGLAMLRQAIAEKLRWYNQIEADPESEIVVSAGATGALYCTCLTLLDPGDEVILFEPYYGYHVNTLLAVGAVARYVKLRPPDWSFSREELQKAVTPSTRAVLINTPANPSGKVFSRSELAWIADWATGHDLFLFTDEIYEHFLYDGRSHVSPGSLHGVADRTITISGFSKTLSITGWRIGYAVAGEPWARRIGHMNDLVYVCAPSPLQYGVAKGISQLGASFYRQLANEYATKRDQLCRVLTQVGLPPHVPQGAYYVLADVSSLPGTDGKQRAMYLLDRTGVATVPGEAFFRGSEGGDVVRLCFAKSDHDLAAACRRLERLVPGNAGQFLLDRNSTAPKHAYPENA